MKHRHIKKYSKYFNECKVTQVVYAVRCTLYSGVQGTYK